MRITPNPTRIKGIKPKDPTDSCADSEDTASVSSGVVVGAIVGVELGFGRVGLTVLDMGFGVGVCDEVGVNVGVSVGLFVGAGVSVSVGVGVTDGEGVGVSV